MIPTRRLVAAAAVPLALALAAAWVPSLLWPILALDGLLVVVGLADALLNRGTVRADRSFDEVQVVGREFPVTVGVVGRTPRTLHLRLTDDAPGAAEGLPVAVRLRPGTRAELRYSARVGRRGEHAFGPVTVRWLSPLGLWERQVALTVPGAVRVYPSFAQLRGPGLRAREGRERVPLRARRRPGGENEFERLRPYAPGDSYRHVDWKATARRRELVSREYGQESNQNILFLLDGGRMMSARHGELTAFDHALNASLVMAQAALRRGDRVGMMVFDRQVRVWLSPRAGARSGARLIRGTYDVFPSWEEPDYALALRFLSQKVRRRSLVVLLTVVADEVNASLTEALVGAMARRHLPLCVWLRDPDLDALVADEPADREARYVQGAAAGLVDGRERALAAVQQRGALIVDSTPDQLTERLLSRYLEIKARRLL